MEKANVSAAIVKIDAKIEEIKTVQQDEVALYATKDKYLDGVGYINEIETIGELVNAQAVVNSQSKSDDDEAIEMLGLTEDERPTEIKRILGFLPKHWNADIKTRLAELRSSILLAQLTDARTKLANHADQFDMDTVGIDDLLAKIA